MAKYDLSVRYFGEAVEDGRIPIKNLAPSLLALSEAFQEIQKISHPFEKEISLDIKATSKGSFVVDLILSNGPDVLNYAIDLLTGKETEAIGNLVMYVSVFYGSIEIIKKLRSNKSVSQNENEGQITITFDDETKITVPKESVEAVKSIGFRKSANEFISPLNSNGIDGIEFRHRKETTVVITKEDVSSFDVPPIEAKELNPTISEVYLQIINVAFEHGKWKFSDGTNQFFAAIEDDYFLKSVEKNEQQFGSTDTLKVSLKTTQRLTGMGLKSEFVILKVLEHIKGSQQLKLDL
ncbi:hypothetical protein SQQ66_15790 [Enterococcus casseliflavus]|uniref:hypothetical protein n=1 Tax=Enterococcus casseliflavus TaxID=37734 RepID=UPI002FDC2348